MHSDRVTATRHINATAADIFAVVADPAGHIRIDGSGMLRTSSSTSRLTKIGETFDVEMDRRPLGDISDLTYYTVRNIVTNIIPDRLLNGPLWRSDTHLLDTSMAGKLIRSPIRSARSATIPTGAPSETSFDLERRGLSYLCTCSKSLSLTSSGL